MKFYITLFILSMFSTSLHAADKFEAVFTPDGWKQSEWSMVKSWRWPHQGKWKQDKDFIVNAVPESATPQELENKRVDETYTSMILNKSFKGDVMFSSTMEFDYQMAPGLIIAAEPVETELGLEYREHYEIVLYNKGINVWRHHFEDGQQKWERRAFLQADFKPNTRYELTAKLQFTSKGPQMTIEVGDHIFGYNEPHMPQDYRIGIVASEGINRFYDFKSVAP